MGYRGAWWDGADLRVHRDAQAMNDRSRIAEYVRREKEIPGNIEPLDIFALSDAAFLQTARGIAGNVL